MEEYIYDISATEQTTPSAAIQETKTMLYLMGYINDSNEIDAFLIDVFNDVTAIDENDEKLWDAQSKGEKQSSPNQIGKNLVTLYKNYISKINFSYYILSFKDVSQKNLKDYVTKQKIKILKFSDFTIKAQKEIKKGLIQECKEKSYVKIEDESKDCVEILKFLNEVYFLLNNDEEENYIKKIAEVKEEIIRNDVLKQIFDEIKGKQMLIKSLSNIEGKRLKTISDVHYLGRTLSIQTINSVILERIIGINLIEKNKHQYIIPTSFNSVLTSKSFIDEDEQSNFLQDCVNDVYRLFVNKNCAKEFWKFINTSIKVIKENKDKDLFNIYELIYDENNVFFRLTKKESIMYFLAFLKGGIKSENL